MDVPTALRRVGLFSHLTFDFLYHLKLACYTNSILRTGIAQEVKTDTAQPDQTSLVAG